MEVTDTVTAPEVEDSAKLDILPTDGPRLEHLKQSLQCSLDRILATWKPSLFARYCNNYLLFKKLYIIAKISISIYIAS